MTNKNIDNITGPLLHSVFFWLKNPDNYQDRAIFEQAIRKLIQTNQQAIGNHLGCPAESEKRDVVDSSFTYCFTMSFPNLEAQNRYQIDPTHHLFIKEAKHLWNRVLVYDSISI